MQIFVKNKQMERYYAGAYGQPVSTSKVDLRIAIIMVFFLLFSLAIAVQLFRLQIIRYNYYFTLASDQHEVMQKLYPVRGAIYAHDKHGESVSDVNDLYPLAMNKSLNLLYAVPKEIKDPEAVLQVLKEVFNLEEPAAQPTTAEEKVVKTEITPAKPLTAEELEKQKEDKQLVEDWRQKLNKSTDPYEPLKHFVSDKEIEILNSYQLKGIYSAREISRFYPENDIGSQLVGFVGQQAENNMLKGSYGIEGCYDKDLAGELGFLRSEKNSYGIADKELRIAKDGDSIVLTIDKTIEFYICDQLKKTIEKTGAERGSVVVINPQTGAIIAMCNEPGFDPNKYSEVKDIGFFVNNSISENYEPGSVMKPFTMAMGLDLGKVDPFMTYQDPGELIISNYPIRNFDDKSHGVRTMTQVLEESLNTGAVFVARKVGLEKFKYYLDAFGFGKRTGIDLCYEEAGNIRALADSNEIYMATASFGQGITATPIQLARALSAVVNEGKLMQPYIIDKIIDSNGEIVKQNKPVNTGQAISPKTAKLLSSMLISVVQNGHAKGAAIPGYLVGGKTGTAQVPDLVHGGYSADTIHTFMGFAPFSDPRLVAVVRLDKVKSTPYAEGSAVPLFRNIAQFVLNYLEIPPEVKN